MHGLFDTLQRKVLKSEKEIFTFSLPRSVSEQSVTLTLRYSLSPQGSLNLHGIQYTQTVQLYMVNFFLLSQIQVRWRYWQEQHESSIFSILPPSETWLCWECACACVCVCAFLVGIGSNHLFDVEGHQLGVCQFTRPPSFLSVAFGTCVPF